MSNGSIHFADGTTISSAGVQHWNAAYGWGDHGAEGYLTSFTETDPVYSADKANIATGTPVYVETDPLFSSSVASAIFAANTSQWSQAFWWGDHSEVGYLISETDPIYSADKANIATGTPLYVESDPLFSASVASAISVVNTSQWSQAYGWGNHASAGYLTSFTETDPVFAASDAFGITATQIGNWVDAHGWGDHAAAGYLTSFTETDPVWTAASNLYYLRAQADAKFATGTPVYVESDPHAVLADGSRAMTGDLDMGGNSITNVAAGSIQFADGMAINSAGVQHWNTAYGWGDHGEAGYITSETDPIYSADKANIATGTPLYVETDPVFSASAASAISVAQTSQWSQAYGWGDHGAEGYLTSETDPVYSADKLNIATGTPVYVESDPVFSVAESGYLKTDGSRAVTGALTVQNAIVVGSNTVATATGMIRFNPATTNFEGYTGTAWVSLTPRYAP